MRLSTSRFQSGTSRSDRNTGTDISRAISLLAAVPVQVNLCRRVWPLQTNLDRRFLLAAMTQGLSRQASWQWALDAPAEHQTALDPPDGKWLFGVMAPGWHITTRPGAVLYEPSYQARGRFSLEAETFLFPGASQSGVGLMVGGRELDGGAPSYVAFLIRRDGSVAVEQRTGGRILMLVDWKRATEVVSGTPENAVKNVLRLDVESGVTRMTVNGKVVAELARPAEEFAGLVGLRVGADINVHVTNLDLTHKLAQPARPR